MVGDDTTPIEIRDATAADAPDIARLLAALGYPATPEAIPARLERLTSDGAVALIAAAASRPIGLATVHVRVVLHAEAPVAQLTALVVDPASRRRGVGRLLVARAERWAAARGAAKLVVTTALHRADAHAFYDGLGYEHTGRRYGKGLEE
jgi:GNAT superfamily N-acetyltransferase